MTARLSFLLAAAAVLTACGSETAPEDHTPASAKLFVSGADVTANLTLARGQTIRVELRWYHDTGEEITGIEAEHFASLTFAPPTLATVVPVTGHHFQFDVTAQNAAGTGTVTVGFGHDELADELSFGPFQVTVP